MGQNLLPARALLGHQARTPLAKPHAVAVAVCGNKKIPARQTDRKTVAAQPQRLPQLYPCHALAAYFNAAHIAGVVPLGFAEPAAGITAGRNAQLGRKGGGVGPAAPAPFSIFFEFLFSKFFLNSFGPI